jgi:hypothetical protein
MAEERDPALWEKLESGLWWRRDDVPLSPEEEAKFYGKGEIKAFTRRPTRKEGP